MDQQPFLAAFTGLLLAGALHAAEWPQYRGPNFDGSTAETIRTNWTEKPLEVVWKRSLQPGWSSPMVAGGRLITQVRGLDQSDPREFCIALDAATGAELWSRPLDIASYDNLVGYDDAIDGPRSSPSVVGNRVFVLTSQLKLFCLRADNGGILWQRDFVAEFGSPVIAWQSAASPLVVGDLVSRSVAAMVSFLSSILKRKSSKMGSTGLEPMAPLAIWICLRSSEEETLNFIKMQY